MENATDRSKPSRRPEAWCDPGKHGWSAARHQGTRTHQEDVGSFITVETASGITRIGAVCDGVTNGGGGEVASRTALEAFMQTLRTAVELASGIEDGDAAVQAMRAAIDQANTAVHAIGEGHASDYGLTTICAAMVTARYIAWGSTGDSHCHVISRLGNGDVHVERLSTPHNLPGDANMMTSALGWATAADGPDKWDPQQNIDSGWIDPDEAAGRPIHVVLSTDGAETLTEAEMTAAVLQAPSGAQALEVVQQVLNKGKPRQDNVAVVVGPITREPARQPERGRTTSTERDRERSPEGDTR